MTQRIERLTIWARRLALFLALALGGWALALSPPADAQIGVGLAGGEEGAAEPATLPDKLTPRQARDLLAVMPDDQVRALLLQQLDARAAAEAEAGSAASTLLGAEALGAAIRSRLGEVLAQAPNAFSAVTLIMDRLRGDPPDRGRPWWTFLILAIAIAVGFVARHFWLKLVRKPQAAIEARNEAGGGYDSLMSFVRAISWLALQLSAILAFYVGAFLVYLIAPHDHRPSAVFITTYVSATAQVMFIQTIVYFIMAPGHPIYRLIPISEEATKRLFRFATALAVIWSFGFLTCALLVVYGAPTALHDFFVILSGLAFLFTMLAAIWNLRGDIAGVIRGERAHLPEHIRAAEPECEGDGEWSAVREMVADWWHVAAIGYMVIVWALATAELLLNHGAAGSNKGILSLAVFFGVPVIDAMIGRALRSRIDGTGPYETRQSAVVTAMRRGARLFLIVAGVVLFLKAWGFSVPELAASGLGGLVAGALIDGGLIVMLAYAGWQIVRALIDRRLEAEGPVDEGGDASEGEGGGAGATRAATLLPLLRSFVFVTIAVMAVLTALASFGVDIGPLLAGAGVVGIAVGFGAQTLVRDIVSGVFFLVDDAFRKGEYIDVGEVKGTVEKISLRSLRLRHHLGPLHTIPFGEITNLTNYSRDWVIMKLQLRLTYDTDPQKVKKIIKRIGAEMFEHEELGPKLLQPPKSQGVLQMDDSAMILRVKFMAKPGEQFVLRRELLHRIRAAFEADGVRFAHREVTVHVANADVSDPGVREAAAAAAREIEPEPAPGAPPTPAPA